MRLFFNQKRKEAESLRRLATFCGAFSAAIFLAHYLIPSDCLMLPALFCALIAVSLLLFHRRWLQPLILALIGFSFGLYLFGMHAMRTVDFVRTWDGSKEKLSGVVLSVPDVYDDYTRAEIRLRLEDGPDLRAYVYDRQGVLANAEPGDCILGTLKLRAADQRYGERYDSYIAKGIYLTANTADDIQLETREGFSLIGLPSVINHKLAETIEKLFPVDTAVFFKALLLGEKSELYQDDSLYLSMSRVGLMHMVAVSGMHVAYLIGMLRYLMGNTRRYAWISILLVWAFVLVTGGSPSAVRAGVMQTILLLAPLLRRENDPPTSLLFALSLILLNNPYAAGSVSLQLSFAAMGGIMLFSDRLAGHLRGWLPRSIPHKLRSYTISNIANSLSVLFFTVPLIGIWFGSVSLLSPLANLLVLWAVPLCFCGGCISCLAAFLLPALGRAAAWLISWPGRYIMAMAGILSRPRFACLYLCLWENRFWLVCVYVLFVFFAVWRIKPWKKWFYPTGIAIFSLFVLLTATRLQYANAEGWMTAVDVGQGQSLAVMSGESTVVVDCGNINELDNAGDRMGQYLLSRGRERINALMLTHLQADHADGIRRLMEYLPVDTILIGAQAEDPNGYISNLQDYCIRNGIKIESVEADQSRYYGDIQLQLFAPLAEGDINERCLSARISIQDYDMMVTGDLASAGEKDLLRRSDLSGTELLIVGHHGSKYSSCEEYLRQIGAKEAIISCGYNSYGHPTPETLERLANCGYTVWRTDEDGTVEIRIA